MKKLKVVILPDLGSNIKTTNWYSWLTKQLIELSLDVIAVNMPDPDMGRKSIWFPFIQKELGINKDTIIIGHSLGASAALRLAEIHSLFGLVIASANYTDLGSPDRTVSDYYSSTWKWDVINKNCNWIVQFASHDDPTAPISESRHIHEQLNCEYHEYTDRGHFGSDYRQEKEFPEIVEVIKRKLFLD